MNYLYMLRCQASAITDWNLEIYMPQPIEKPKPIKEPPTFTFVSNQIFSDTNNRFNILT